MCFIFSQLINYTLVMLEVMPNSIFLEIFVWETRHNERHI